MADGSIGSKVVSELVGVGKQVIGDATKVATDVATQTIETVASGGISQQHVGGVNQGGGEERGQAANDPQMTKIVQKKAAAQRRFNEVKEELEQYRLQIKREQMQKEQIVEEEKKVEELQKKESDKKQREQELLKRMSKQYGGTGEVSKGKY